MFALVTLVDPRAVQKRAILDLRRLGYSTEEIVVALRISRATLGRREAALRRNGQETEEEAAAGAE